MFINSNKVFFICLQKVSWIQSEDKKKRFKFKMSIKILVLVFFLLIFNFKERVSGQKLFSGILLKEE